MNLLRYLFNCSFCIFSTSYFSGFVLRFLEILQLLCIQYIWILISFAFESLFLSTLLRFLLVVKLVICAAYWELTVLNIAFSARSFLISASNSQILTRSLRSVITASARGCLSCFGVSVVMGFPLSAGGSLINWKKEIMWYYEDKYQIFANQPQYLIYWWRCCMQYSTLE